MSNAVMTLNHPIEAMQFRLVYDGPLKSGNASNLVPQKQEIRRAMHEQIRELWHTHPGLEDVRDYIDSGGFAELKTVPLGNFKFFPLVTAARFMTCHLDMLILRRCPPSSVIYHGGDLDNRIKTFIDALRVPQQAEEIPAMDAPKNDESPFFCLMEDDKLITGLGMRSDRLLVKQGEEEHRNDIRIVMDVSIHVSKLSWPGTCFAGD